MSFKVSENNNDSAISDESSEERIMREKSLDETIEIKVPQTDIAVEILFNKYGASSPGGFKIHRPFYRDGEITNEAKKLIFKAFKEYPNLITITPELMKDLPEIIMKYMEKFGYDMLQVRNRILSLQKGKQDQ